LRNDDESLRFLLAGGRLSGDVHDKILARLTPRPARRFRRWQWLLGTTLVAGVAAAGVAVGPGIRSGSAVEPWRATKGEAAGPSLNARCPARGAGTCRPGDPLVFEADGGDAPVLLAAYADGPAGERLWFFPAADGHLATVPAHAGTVLAREVGRVGKDWPSGRYTLQLFLLSRPADRATLLAGQAAVQASATITLSVVP